MLKRKHAKLYLFLVLVTCSTAMATEIYAPSLLAMARDLNTTLDLAQWTLVIFMMGTASTQLVYGPLSDAWGRKKPLLLGLFILSAGTCVCATAPSIEVLLFGRLLQGFGAGAASALWRTIFRDLFSQEEMARIGGHFTTLVVFLIPAAPVLGGYLEHWGGWRMTFTALLVYNLATILAVAKIYRESNDHQHEHVFRWRAIVTNYLFLLKHPLFMGIVSSVFFTYGAFFSWIVSNPILMMDLLKVDPVSFGWLIFFSVGTSVFFAGVFNGRMNRSFGMMTTMRCGWLLMALANVAMIAMHHHDVFALKPFVACILVFFFGAAWIWPNAFATAFAPVSKVAGSAGSLYSFVQMLGASLFGALVAHLPHDNPGNLGVICLVCIALSSLIFHFIARPAMLKQALT